MSRNRVKIPCITPLLYLSLVVMIRSCEHVGPLVRAPGPAFLAVAIIVGSLLGGIGCTSEATPPRVSPLGLDDGTVVVDRVVSEDATFRVVRVLEGLDHPWSVAWLPDGRMLITERPGRLRLVDGDSIRTVAGLPDIRARGQGGLLEVALPPNHAETGWIYLTYSAPGDGGLATALMRARLDGATLVDQDLLYQQTPFTRGGRHSGSRIVFPGDGTLLFSVGDRGLRDPAQDPRNAIGSIIRLNLDGSIPEDNPFIGRDDILPEIYSYGHRNPQGMAVAADGTLWAHEHGPRGGDELNRIEGGKNYGWPAITYGREYSNNAPIGGTEAPGMEQPAVIWTPSIAPSGLAVYRGDAFPGWRDNLFVGALAHQKLQRVVLSGGAVAHQETLLDKTIGRIRDVRMGPDGLLYILTDASNGGLYRLEPVA